MSTEVEQLKAAAQPFAVCTAGWDRTGYGAGYTCLDREIDIAKPDHPTTDWWPRLRPCDGCELARALGHRGKGTLTPEQFRSMNREQNDRREYERLRVKYEPSQSGRRAEDG